MAGKKRKQLRQQRPRGAAFPPNTVVKVRHGVSDPNYTDVSLEGYVGTVTEVSAESTPRLYLIRWSAETLARMPASFLARCEADDLDPEKIWLEEGSLEPAAEGEAATPYPVIRRPRPLDTDDPEDRLRVIFGLTGDDPLPPVDPPHLRRMLEYLERRLHLPTRALHMVDPDTYPPTLRVVTLHRLLPVEEANEEEGLLAEISGEGDPERETVPLYQVGPEDTTHAGLAMRDYIYWVTFPRDEDVGGLPLDLFQPGARPALLPLLCRWGVYGAGAGASLGAIYRAMESAHTAMLVGAGILGLLGYYLGSRLPAVRGPGGISLSLGGGLLGALVGGAVGGVMGILAVAVIGSLGGAMIGSILGRILALAGHRPLGELGWSMLGAFGGGFTFAWYRDQARALEGAQTGAIAGAAVLLVLGFIFSGLVVVAMPTAPPRDRQDD